MTPRVKVGLVGEAVEFRIAVELYEEINRRCSVLVDLASLPERNHWYTGHVGARLTRNHRLRRAMPAASVLRHALPRDGIAHLYSGQNGQRGIAAERERLSHLHAGAPEV